MKTWPLIRHARWWYHTRQINRWMTQYGKYHWLTISPLDERYLQDVWEGKA